MCLYHNNISVTTRLGQKKVVTAKCGICIDCLQERQNAWKLRLVKESLYWNHLYFFTLTFDNNNLPCVVVSRDEYDTIYYSGTLPQCIAYCDKFGISYDCEATMKGYEIDSLINIGEYSDYVIKSSADNPQVSKFIKRVRTQFLRDYGRKLVMKYFICSEYGPSQDGTRRPHYHGVLFSDENYNTLAPYFRKWESIGRYEFVESRPVEGDSRENSHSKIANYVSKYCAKGSFDSRLDDTKYKHIQKARFSCSNGIGLRWLEQRKDDWLKYVPTSIEIENKYSWIPFDEAIIERYFNTGVLHFPLNGKYYPINADLFGRAIPNSYEFHVLDKIKAEVENLCDNLLVYDGDFGYKMPRFMYERLFLRKIIDERLALTTEDDLLAYKLRTPEMEVRYPFLSCFDGVKVEHIIAPPHHIVRGTFLNPLNYDIPKKISTHKTSRYVAESFLSNSIAYCLRMRAQTLLDREVQQLESNLYFPKDKDAYLEVACRKERAKILRAQVAEDKLHDFYFRNSVVNPEFDI